MPGAAASTSDAGEHAAAQVLAVMPGPTRGEVVQPATAVDALVAGAMAIAARYPSVLLGGITILLGGTGEGLLAIDGRVRQAGVSAARPRGFVPEEPIPGAARIATPGLPAALAIAHAGRGTRTFFELARAAIASAEPSVPAERIESIRALGREGARVLHAGPIRDALLGIGARSLGGVLTSEDLEGARPSVVPAASIGVDGRRWAIAPWCERLRVALSGASADTTLEDPETAAAAEVAEVVVLATADVHGAVAVAAIPLATASLALPGTGLEAPLFGCPVLRGVARTAPGAVLSAPAPIGVASAAGAGSRVELAIGVGGGGVGVEEIFAQVARSLSKQAALLEDALAQPRARRGRDVEGRVGAWIEERLDRSFGVAAGVLVEGHGRSRAIHDPRR